MANALEHSGDWKGLSPRYCRQESRVRRSWEVFAISFLRPRAGALAYAIQEEAAKAVLIVHEFVTDHTRDDHHRRNSRDLDVFINRLSGGAFGDLAAGGMVGPLHVPGRPLFANVPGLYLGTASRHLRTQQT